MKSELFTKQTPTNEAAPPPLAERHDLRTQLSGVPMAQEAEVGLDAGLLYANLRETAEHPPLAGCTQDAVAREMHPAEEIHARCERLDEHLIGMQLKREVLA